MAAPFVKLIQPTGAFRAMLIGLRDVGGGITRSSMRVDLAASSVPIERAARANLRAILKASGSRKRRRPGGRATGDLVRSMAASRARKFTTTRRGRYVLVVGPQFPLGAHGAFLEFGTRKQKARPFLRPAFDSRSRESTEILIARLNARLDKLASRAVRG